MVAHKFHDLGHEACGVDDLDPCAREKREGGDAETVELGRTPSMTFGGEVDEVEDQRMLAAMLPWVSMTPLGLPLVPLV